MEISKTQGNVREAKVSKQLGVLRPVHHYGVIRAKKAKKGKKFKAETSGKQTPRNPKKHKFNRRKKKEKKRPFWAVMRTVLSVKVYRK